MCVLGDLVSYDDGDGIQEVGEAAFAFTSQDAGDDTLDSDANVPDLTAIFTLTEDSLTVDAGLVSGPAPGFGFAIAANGKGIDYGNAVVVDTDGNAYVTGLFCDTVDFDPGPGTFSLTSVGSSDGFVAKYSSAGALVWARQLEGPAFDDSYAIALDDCGNVYTTGWFRDTVDFDPEPGTHPLTSVRMADAFVWKLNAAGDFVWARQFGGSEKVQAQHIAIGEDGSVYSIGCFGGTADFDPGVGTSSLTSAGNYDTYISKLDAAGDFVWAKRMGGTTNAWGRNIAVAADGSVVLTGIFEGIIDSDPGPATSLLMSAGSRDTFVAKLDVAGNLVWSGKMGGTGTDHSEGIAVGTDGSIYVTGYFWGIADFDPGASVVELTSAGNYDIFVAKFNAAGGFEWAERMGGSAADYATEIAFGPNGLLCLTGKFHGDADFDSGPARFELSSAGSGDIFVARLDTTGVFVWARRMGGTSDDSSLGIAVANDGSIYATGIFQGTANFDGGPGTYELTSAGETDIFVTKISPFELGVFLWPDADAADGEAGESPVVREEEVLTVDVDHEMIPSYSTLSDVATIFTLVFNAADYNWFVARDEGQSANGEWDLTDTPSLSVNPQSMDPLTAVVHELGHYLGFDDDHSDPSSDDLMNGWLERGERRTLSISALDNLFANTNWLDHGG